MPELLLIAAMDVEGLIPTLAAGGAVFAFAYWVVLILSTSDLEQGKEWRYDVSRINELRKEDSFFRLFQPVIQGFAKFNRGMFADHLPEVKRELQAAGLSRSWLPEEYLGKLQFLALLISPFIFITCIRAMGAPGVILAVVLTVLLAFIFRRYLTHQAKTRLTLIKKRLPLKI